MYLQGNVYTSTVSAHGGDIIIVSLQHYNYPELGNASDV